MKPGEILKRVATPFPPSRFVYHRQHYPKDDKAEDMMFLRWDNGLQFSGTIGGMKSDPRKVQLVFLLRYLPMMLGDVTVRRDGRRELDVRGDPNLLAEGVEGDFVGRSNVPFEKIVVRMAEILRDECKLPVRLTLQQDKGAFTLLVERQGEKLGKSPIEEHKSVTITKAYWLASKDTPDVIRQGARRPKEGEGHMYLHGDEWFADQDKTQYLKFLRQVDRSFVFRAKGHTDVKGQVQLSFWTDPSSGLRDILLVIPKEEYAKMANGVAYAVHPMNSAAACQWRVKEGLTITRGQSLEEKQEILQERFNKLEKRLEELEKKKVGK